MKSQPNKAPGPRSEYIFATCRAGSERALKDQVARRAKRMLRPAFMRPQLITWKSSRPLDAGFSLDSVFARVSGISLGMYGDDTELAAKVFEQFGALPLHLHVFPRETPEEGVAKETWAEMDAKWKALSAALDAAGVTIQKGGRPKSGEMVLDVIMGEPGEKMFLGAHGHSLERHPLPGALPRLTLPPEAPSRAYLKMEQAIIWAGLDGPRVLQGKTALELGCAPGGATMALLRRGMNVVGVDSAEMDPRVLEVTRKGPGKFTHLRVPAADLIREKEMLPRPVHVLISDMNVAPPIMLRMIERMQTRVRARVLILTLKLNDRLVEERIPRYIEHVAQFAPSPVRAIQLAANRAEFCIVAGEFVHRRG